jgi:hypothetical protein
MASVTIDGTKYPMPRSAKFTFREMAAVERVTGLTPSNLWLAYLKESSSLALALALVALMRAGKLPPGQEEELLDWEVDQIELDFTEDDEETPEGSQQGPPSGAGGEPAGPSS